MEIVYLKLKKNLELLVEKKVEHYQESLLLIMIKQVEIYLYHG